jgi:DNA-binding response OmpR family regulator
MPMSGPTRVLLLVEQPLIARMITLALDHGVCLTREAATVSTAAALLNTWQPHLAIIDMDIGGELFVQGMARTVEGGGTKTPVIALTRRGDLKTKLDAYAQGVEDIMTVPFSPEELLARVLVIARRVYGESDRLMPVVRIGGLAIDILHQRMQVDGMNVRLTGVEQNLLYLLAANAGRVVAREEILDTLWGPDFLTESSVIEQHIRSLRAKLHDDWRKPRYIATVKGQGYRFLPTGAVDPTS